jgi:hypothetical protein
MTLVGIVLIRGSQSVVHATDKANVKLRRSRSATRSVPGVWVARAGWLAHCYNHGDTCGACPSIIEEEEGDDDEDEGNEGGELDVSACAAPCSHEDSPALQRKTPTCFLFATKEGIHFV